MTDDDWEKLRHMTVDQLVTETKLLGSAQSFRGTTTPEGYVFRVIVAVGSTTENMAAVGAVAKAENMIRYLASWFVQVDKEPPD